MMITAFVLLGLLVVVILLEVLVRAVPPPTAICAECGKVVPLQSIHTSLLRTHGVCRCREASYTHGDM
jgi:hypothetical protein